MMKKMGHCGAYFLFLSCWLLQLLNPNICGAINDWDAGLTPFSLDGVSACIPQWTPSTPSSPFIAQVEKFESIRLIV
jgi:hypothetical protein